MKRAFSAKLQCRTLCTPSRKIATTLSLCPHLWGVIMIILELVIKTGIFTGVVAETEFAL